YAQAGSAPSTTGTPWATYNEPQTPGDDITVKIDGLTNGNVWFVKVVAEDSEGNRAVPAGSLSRTPTDTTPPWFAGLASITDPLKDGDSLTLSWKLAEDKNTGPATKDLPLTYNIYYGKTSETFSWAAKTTLQIDPNPNATYQHVITGLDAGVEYRFLVSVVDPAGNNDTNMVFRTATPLDETAPTFAGLATATNTGAGGAVRLEWTEAIDQSDVEYMILKSTTQGVFNDPPVIISNTFFNVEGLTNNQQYWFRVWARDIFGNTRYVNNSDKSATPADTQAPWFASTEWSAEDQETGGAVKLTWSQAVDNNTAPGASWAFRVFRKLATSPSYPDTPLATIPYDPLLTEYEYVDTGRTNGVAYHYQVRARDNTGNVYALVQKTVTPTDKEPPVFAGITAAATPAGTEGIVRIEWAAAMDGNTDPNGEIYYKIYRRVSGTTTWGEAIATVLIEQTPYFDNGGSGSSTVGSLTIGETYEYRVLAFDDSNNQNLGPVILPVLVEDKLAPRFNGASVWGEDLGTGKSVRLYWAAATDSSTPVRYNVYFDTLETFVPDPANRIVSKALGTSVIIENLPANDVEYWFIVRPVDAKDNEQAGEDYPIMLKPTDVTPPVWTTTVGIQIAEDLGTYGEVRLSWGEATDNTGPITYLVYYSKLEANVFNTIRATTTQTTLDIAGLDNGVRYYFGIRVRDSAATPNTDTNTIILAATPSDTVKPLFNGLATVTPDAEGGILHLSWTAATDASTAYGKQINYNVYLSTQEQITVSGPADNTYLLASTTLTSYKVEKDLRGDPLVNGRIYYFLVKAIDSSSNMDINTVVLNGTPEDTTAPEFAGASVARDLEYGGAVRIEWSAGKDKYGVTYRIFRSDDPNFNGGVPGDQNNPPIAQNLVGLFYEDTGLLNGQTYYYIVWARDVNGNFNKSQTVPIAITPS
ncbi:MAG: fibronectin type III domain-containing protein, partial [Candidatus Thermoplasmatota archaeon]|nr:fibronectin type III domain-containing protein [Candidatus Thermoplasmatota archaeon]